MNTDSDEQRVDVLRQTIIALVRRQGPDLTARQFAVFLICYLDDEAQTVRGLAAKLSVAKPAITRALDRLSEFDLVRRKTDPLDRRSVWRNARRRAWRFYATSRRYWLRPEVRPTRRPLERGDR